MTERRVELQVRIWTEQGAADSARLLRPRSGADAYKYLASTLTVEDDDLFKVLQVVNYIDLGVGHDQTLARAEVYERGVNAYSQLVVHVQLSVADEEARENLIAKIKASNFLWESFNP